MAFDCGDLQAAADAGAATLSRYYAAADKAEANSVAWAQSHPQIAAYEGEKARQLRARAEHLKVGCAGVFTDFRARTGL